MNSELAVTLLIIALCLVSVLLVLVVLCRLRSVKKYQEQLDFVQVIMNTMPSPVFYKDRAGIYLGCNEAFLTMLGVDRESVVGKTAFDLAPPKLAQVYEKADNELFESGGLQEYETQVKFADGSLRDMFFSKAVYKDMKGQPAGLLGVMLDISDRKAAESQLKRTHAELEMRVGERTSELAASNRLLEEEIFERHAAEQESRKQSDFLDTILNSISHGLVVIDAEDFSVKMANAAAQQQSLQGAIHCFSMNHGKSFPCDDLDQECPVRTVKQTGLPAVVQHNHLGSDESNNYVEVHAYPVFNDKGEVVQVVENIMDITERKEAEAAMLKAKEMAETTSRLMSEFLDTVSHELRTPMTSVHGFAKLIEKSFESNIEPLTEETPELKKKVDRIKDNLDIIISESERLTHLINEHLDLSKLESGRVEWHNLPISPSLLAERAAASSRSLFEDTGLTFNMDVEDDLPTINADHDRILQVLINLISNAVKFTEEGSVTCSVKNNGDSVLFAVSDTGIGIPVDQHESIFSKFSQIQTKKSGKPSGTGLGLAISMKIIEHHGGKIWVESTLGEGSTFFFTVPVA